jgi:hypothetical protein
MSDQVNDEYTTPLTKQPKQSHKKKEIVKEDIKEIQGLGLDKVKTRKPKTEKQMEQFKKVIEARKKKIEDNKLQKKIEASKFLLGQGITQGITQTPTIKKKLLPKLDNDLHEDDSSSEEQVVVIKKKKKSKKKKIIVVEEDSDDSSEEEEIKPVRSLKTQRNKKSVIKIHNDKDNKPSNNNYKNYFV